jgi:hypothetical protein
VQITVRLRWEPRMHATTVFVGPQVFVNDLSDKVGGSGIGRVGFSSCCCISHCFFSHFSVDIGVANKLRL